ncbi:hypothetical protein D3C75_1289040 [compost metagenome]
MQDALPVGFYRKIGCFELSFTVQLIQLVEGSGRHPLSFTAFPKQNRAERIDTSAVLPDTLLKSGGTGRLRG